MLSPRSRALARANTLLLLKDPAPFIVQVIIPLVLMAFLRPSMAAQLHALGSTGANGSEQLVPGMTVMFSFLCGQQIAMIFYREHYWGTWERLRAAGASGYELMLGKSLPLLAMLTVQTALLMAAGALLFDFRISGSWLAFALLAAGNALAVLTWGLLGVAIFRTLDQAMVLGNLGGMLMAGLGGALAPAATLPGWAQAAAHVTPTYWVLRGMGDVTLHSAGLGDVLGPLLAVLAFAVVCGGVAVWRFNPTEAKIGTT